ncbi:15978_t:CDS:2, partial [Cetraspora pellucida]
MCVETGRPLILTDLEIIYGSLYDLFNQNFLSEGNSSEERDKKNFTRISLGPYSNPMLYAKLPLADPPLLNRFEKQRLTLNETLSSYEKGLFERLKEWARQISTIVESEENTKKLFNETDMFIGFSSEESLQSLVIDQCGKNPDLDDDAIIHACKEALISIATSDSIVRADKSYLKISDEQEVKHWQHFYFHDKRHSSIRDFYQVSINNNSEKRLVIINTFSNINTDVKSCLEDIINCQIDKLSTFKSEAELQNQIKRFYESDSNLYILQCDPLTVKAG